MSQTQAFFPFDPLSNIVHTTCADPDWFFDLDEDQRAVLQQPASRGRGDIMASDQMKAAAKL